VTSAGVDIQVRVGESSRWRAHSDGDASSLATELASLVAAATPPSRPVPPSVHSFTKMTR